MLYFPYNQKFRSSYSNEQKLNDVQWSWKFGITKGCDTSGQKLAIGQYQAIGEHLSG